MELFTDMRSYVTRKFHERLKKVFTKKPEILSYLINDSRRYKTIDKIISEVRSVEMKIGVALKTEDITRLADDIADMYAYNMLRIKSKDTYNEKVDSRTMDYLDDVKTQEDKITFSGKKHGS